MSRSIDDLVKSHKESTKSFFYGTGYIAGYGYLMEKSLETTVLGALSFTPFSYGLRMMQNAKYPLAKRIGTGITLATAYPAYALLKNATVNVLGKLAYGLKVSSFALAWKPLAAVSLGAYLGYRIVRRCYSAIKNVFFKPKRLLLRRRYTSLLLRHKNH